MTEKDKMLAGEFYFSFDPVLTNERIEAKKLYCTFNTTPASAVDKRKDILKKLFRSENECHIEPPFRCDYGYNISIGENFYANFGCIILDVNRVTIGDNVMLGPYVQIYSATHPSDPALRLEGKEMGYPITIGNNVWIGGGAIVCAAVAIGDNTVIGAGSVVTKDIPPNVVAAGNPCRVIRKLMK